MKPVIIVHGGAKTITADKVEANQAGCLAAVEAGCILLDCQGQIGWAHNSSDMAVAYMCEELAHLPFSPVRIKS